MKEDKEVTFGSGLIRPKAKAWTKPALMPGGGGAPRQKASREGQRFPPVVPNGKVKKNSRILGQDLVFELFFDNL